MKKSIPFMLLILLLVSCDLDLKYLSPCDYVGIELKFINQTQDDLVIASLISHTCNKDLINIPPLTIYSDRKIASGQTINILDGNWGANTLKLRLHDEYIDQVIGQLLVDSISLSIKNGQKITVLITTITVGYNLEFI